MALSLDNISSAIKSQLSANPSIVVIGSANFWGDDSEQICAAIGASLTKMKSLVLITGGVPVVGEEVGRSFYKTRKELALARKV